MIKTLNPSHALRLIPESSPATHTKLIQRSSARFLIHLLKSYSTSPMGSTRGIMTREGDCGFEVNDFELQLLNMSLSDKCSWVSCEPRYPPRYEFNIITAVLQQRWFWLYITHQG